MHILVALILIVLVIALLPAFIIVPLQVIGIVLVALWTAFERDGWILGLLVLGTAIVSLLWTFRSHWLPKEPSGVVALRRGEKPEQHRVLHDDVLPPDRPDAPPGARVEAVYRWHEGTKQGLVQYYYEDDQGNWVFVKPKPEYERRRQSVLPRR